MTPGQNGANKKPLVPFDHKLVLNQWLLSLFKVNSFEEPVSYTHLDGYKRQEREKAGWSAGGGRQWLHISRPPQSPPASAKKKRPRSADFSPQHAAFTQRESLHMAHGKHAEPPGRTREGRMECWRRAAVASHFATSAKPTRLRQRCV